MNHPTLSKDNNHSDNISHEYYIKHKYTQGT